jgi:hypothetical protein
VVFQCGLNPPAYCDVVFGPVHEQLNQRFLSHPAQGFFSQGPSLISQTHPHQLCLLQLK